MKVLVMGGMHGNEPLGIDIVQRLLSQPMKNVTAIIANADAKQQNKRFTNTDLNRSFPGDEKSYEGQRAKELLELCKDFDLVLDFHNTYCPENDCAFVGEKADKVLLDAASFIGLKRVIVADYDCINKYATNCISVEISLDSSRNNVDEWLKTIEKLSSIQTLPEAQDIIKYRFVYRMTLDDNARLNLDGVGLRAFKPIGNKIALKIGVPSPAYPIFIADKYTPYNYGGLLNKL
ncbi:MAG: succinylglutamate desuccinylase/aspartoacylase family protein [Candidatus Microsaccharimonas sp.]